MRSHHYLQMQHALRPHKRFNLDLTLARAEGSLAVAPGPVVAVYGLHLVEASPAIYVIHPLGVARVDKVVAGPGVSSPAVPVRTSAKASWVAKSAPTITTITVSKMYILFIRLPP